MGGMSDLFLPPGGVEVRRLTPTMNLMRQNIDDQAARDVERGGALNTQRWLDAGDSGVPSSDETGSRLVARAHAAREFLDATSATQDLARSGRFSPQVDFAPVIGSSADNDGSSTSPTRPFSPETNPLDAQLADEIGKLLAPMYSPSS